MRVWAIRPSPYRANGVREDLNENIANDAEKRDRMPSLVLNVIRGGFFLAIKRTNAVLILKGVN